MIIRKPYAFLIKNFRKIHIFLLILGFYVAYKLFDVSRFVSDFTKLGTYDLFSDPITKHITWLLTLSLLLLVAGNLALLFLLKHKGKPWKIYLVPTVTYVVLLFVLNMIKSFFKNYTGSVAATDLVMSKDLLFVFSLVQIPAMGILLMRVLGLDIKKFNFNIDKEFLELSEEDREEIEIGLDIDKNTFIRAYRRLIRNIKYVYLEHKGICNTILGILLVFLLFGAYKTFFITHKSYKQGDYYSVNGYTFKINNAYFTDKDFNGKKVERGSNFVIVDLTVINHAESRKIYLENFHIKNGIDDYITTNKTFSTEFKDLGDTYESTRMLKRDESLDCIIVYKVDKKLDKNRFVLYYQEGGYLRKIKLKVQDVSKIEEVTNLKLDDELEINFRNNPDNIIIENVVIGTDGEYTTRKKSSTGSTMENNTIHIDGDNRILQIDFSSDVWEAKNMIDFLNNYGKLIYKDSESEEDTIDIVNPIGKTYYGKSVFLQVPVELESAKEVSFEFIIRNKHYIYKII